MSKGRCDHRHGYAMALSADNLEAGVIATSPDMKSAAGKPRHSGVASPTLTGASEAIDMAARISSPVADGRDPKRKRPTDEASEQSGPNLGAPPGSPTAPPLRHVPGPESKRARLDSSSPRQGHRPNSAQRMVSDRKVHGLPPSVWKRVFGHVPPIFLGRLLRVCRDFKALLDPSDPRSATGSSEWPLDPQDIWLSSRHTFASSLPKAMPDQNELQMWKLIRGNSCQLCNKSKALLTIGNTADPWHADSGTDGVRVVWPLGIRCCTACLQLSVEQEKSLLFSSFPSFILPAIPCVFLAQESHYVHSTVVRDSTPPAGLQITKAYSKAAVMEARKQFANFKGGDQAAADQWVSNLEAATKRLSESAMAWEQWETRGGLKKVNSRKKNPSAIKQLRGPRHPPQLQAISSQTENEISSPSNTSPLASAGTGSTMISPFTPNPLSSPYHPPAGSPGASSSRPYFPGVSRPSRDLRDVNETKAARKADIERRAMLLDPPITPDVLAQMDSFQAALQIPLRLHEQAWEVLKPRLISQRDEAEQRESERSQQEAAFKVLAEERTQQDARPKEAKDALDQAWDISQSPIRNLLSRYADEFIQTHWAGGEAVTRDNCAKFAADVLMHVRRQFYENHNPERIPSHWSGHTDDPGNDETFLVLENMKWIFDNKAKRFTEPFQKDVFLCNGCEGGMKFYGFEAVIQHYAAKHTTSLSQGNVVVHWRAKWPDIPPFHPDPEAVKSRYSSVPAPGNDAQPQLQGFMQAFPDSAYPHPHGNFIPLTYPTASHIANSQPTPGHDAYGSQYSQGAAHYHASMGPQPLTGSIQAAVANGIEPGQMIHSPANSAVIGPFTPPQAGPYGAPSSAYLYQSSFSNYQQYQAQLAEMAKHAREIWFAINTVKDIPASVRIHVVIQHVAKRFANTYSYGLDISMFLYGLNQHPQMRPVRSLNGLACRACVGQANLSWPGSSPGGGVDGSKQYTLPLLLNHFKIVHVDNHHGTAGPLDWKNDMIELPDQSQILRVMSASGMDDHKLSLVAQTLPNVFPSPLPKVAALRGKTLASRNITTDSQPAAAASAGLSTKDHHRSARGQGTPHAGARLPSANSSKRQSPSSSKEAEPPDDDEYDPHRPTYLGRIVEAKQGPGSIRRSGGHPSAISPEVAKLPDSWHRSSADSCYPYNNSYSNDTNVDRRHTPTTEADRFLSELHPAIQQAHTNGGAAGQEDHSQRTPIHGTSYARWYVYQQPPQSREEPDAAAARDISSRSAGNSYDRHLSPTHPNAHELHDREQWRERNAVSSHYYRCVPSPDITHVVDYPQTVAPRGATDTTGRIGRSYYATQGPHDATHSTGRDAKIRERGYESTESRGQFRSPVSREYAPLRYFDSNGYEIPGRSELVYAPPGSIIYTSEPLEQHPRHHVASSARDYEVPGEDHAGFRTRRLEYIPLPESHPGERRYVYTEVPFPAPVDRNDREAVVGDYYERGAAPYYEGSAQGRPADGARAPTAEIRYQHSR